jgi:hypothetical protein
MRVRHTVILVVVAAALAGYLFLIERPRQRENDRRKAAQTDLADFDIGRVAEVTIVRPDATLKFARTGEGGVWLMESPVTDRARDVAVTQLLGVLSEAEIVRDLGLQTDLSPFGLDDPAATITVVSIDGDTVVSLDVGDLTLEKYNAYARRHGPNSGILLVPTGVRRYSQGEPFTFRSDRLIDFDLDAVRELTVSWPDSATTWVRDADGEWSTVVDGNKIRGLEQILDEMVRRVRAIRAKEFVPESEIDVVQPFDSPPRYISVTVDDGSRRTIRLGRTLETRVYAGSRPYDGAAERVVLTDTKVLDLFEQSVFDLRDRRLLRFDPKRLGKVVFESPEVSVTLVRPGNEWGFPNPAAGAPEQQRVQRVLSALAELEHGRVLDEAPGEGSSYGLSNAPIRLTIYDKDGEMIDRLLCTRDERTPGAFVATSNYSAVAAQLPEEDIETLIFGFKGLR